MTSKKRSDFKAEIPQEMSGLIQTYHDTLIADSSLSDIDVILTTLYLIEHQNRKAGAKYDECKDFFVSLGRKEDNFRKVLHKGKKDSLLKESDRVLYFLSDGLKKIRKIFGQVGKSPVYVIKSGENFTAIKLFEEFLTSQFNGEEILLCDSHVSHSTLFPFSVLKGRIKSLKLLTTNVYDSDKFEDYKKKLIKELGIQIEVKVNQKIHDRFIIDGDQCWSIGSSIKDLGNKDATIREISEVASSMKDLFLERWKEAK